MIFRFIMSDIGGGHFVRQFLKLWKKDRDAQWACKARWDEPYDDQLQAALLRQEITRDEFLRRWNELWGPASESDAEFLALLDQIYSACDSFGADPCVAAASDEERLRSFVARKFGAYFLTLSDRMTTSR